MSLRPGRPRRVASRVWNPSPNPHAHVGVGMRLMALWLATPAGGHAQVWHGAQGHVRRAVPQPRHPAPPVHAHHRLDGRHLRLARHARQPPRRPHRHGLGLAGAPGRGGPGGLDTRHHERARRADRGAQGACGGGAGTACCNSPARSPPPPRRALPAPGWCRRGTPRPAAYLRVERKALVPCAVRVGGCGCRGSPSWSWWAGQRWASLRSGASRARARAKQGW